MAPSAQGTCFLNLAVLKVVITSAATEGSFSYYVVVNVADSSLYFFRVPESTSITKFLVPRFVV